MLIEFLFGGDSTITSNGISKVLSNLIKYLDTYYNSKKS